MDYKKLIEEINKRQADIQAEIRALKPEDDKDGKNLESLNSEFDKNEERAKAYAKAEEINERSAEALRTLVPTASNPIPESREKTTKMSKRDSIAFLFGKEARKESINDAEKRALDTSLFTTATTYVAATADANGVNNSGVFIPTTLLLDLLQEDKVLTPILDDVMFTNVKGLTVFPYRKSRTTAHYKTEGAKVADGQMEFTSLSLKKGWLQINVEVTDEIEALSSIELGNYIVNQIEQDLSEDWSAQIIYGAGVDGSSIAGVTNGLTAKTYSAGGELAAVLADIKLLKGKYRRGAKVYMAQDIYDSIVQTKDSNGDFIFPQLNNASALINVGGVPCAVDETLNDGDFVIGNVARYYKANFLTPISVGVDVYNATHIKDYVVSVYAACAPRPDAFILGSLAA